MIGFILGILCGFSIAYVKIAKLESDNDELWEYINELEDDLELYNT